MLGQKVDFVNDCIGKDVQKKVSRLKEGQILLLENLRFYDEEKANDNEFAKHLAEGMRLVCARWLWCGPQGACQHRSNYKTFGQVLLVY